MWNHNRTRLMVIAGAICFLFAALGFSGALNLASFKKNYLESLAAGYQVGAISTKRMIEYSVRYGKPLDKFNGMSEILTDLKNGMEWLDQVRVISTGGKVLYDANGPRQEEWLPQKLRQAARFNGENAAAPYLVSAWGAEYHVFVPLKDKNNVWIGSLDLSSRADLINSRVDGRVGAVAQSTAVIALVSVSVLAFLLFIIAIVDSQGELRRRRIVLLVSAVFVLAQAFSCLLNLQVFQKAYVEVAKSTMTVLARSVKGDIDSVVGRGVSYNRLVGLDQYLEQLIVNSPEIERIAITDSSGAVMYRAPSKSASADFARGETEQYRYFQTLIDDMDGVGGTVHVWLSQQYFYNKSREMAFDFAAVSGLFILVLTELVYLTPLLLRGLTQYVPASLQTLPHGLRPAAFLFFFAVSLVLGIGALKIESLKLATGPLVPALAAGAGAWIGDLGARRFWRGSARLLYVLGSVVALVAGMAVKNHCGPISLFGLFVLSGIGWGVAAAGWRCFSPVCRGPESLPSLYGGIFCGSFAGGITGALMVTRVMPELIFAGAVFLLLLVLPLGRQPEDGKDGLLLNVRPLGPVTGWLAAASLGLTWSAVSNRPEGIGLLVLGGLFSAAGCWWWLHRLGVESAFGGDPEEDAREGG